MNMIMEHRQLTRFLLFVFLISGLLIVSGCGQEQAEQVFIPAVQSNPTATAVSTPAEQVFVPAVQSQGDDPAPTATEVEPTAVSSPTPSATTTGQGNADVLFVTARASDENMWTFIVTVTHPDTGWEDYADGWDVVLPDGTVIKPDQDSPFTRLLTHPHQTEQPFTRSQSNIEVPAGVTAVTVRAHDLVDGFGGREVVVDLSVASGPDFSVKR